jgi:hypothetical protein
MLSSFKEARKSAIRAVEALSEFEASLPKSMEEMVAIVKNEKISPVESCHEEALAGKVVNEVPMPRRR